MSAGLPEAVAGAAGGHPAGGDPAGAPSGADRSVRVSVPQSMADEAGAFLMDVLGPFAEERPVAHDPGCVSGSPPEERVVLVFYPPADGPATRDELLPLVPEAFAASGVLQVEAVSVPRDWVEGWREHFRPIVIGAVRIRPPWEAPLAAGEPCGADAAVGADEPSRRPAAPQAGADGRGPLVDVVINPGLGFGTGLHPTTRGTLLLLQEGRGRAAQGADLGALGQAPAAPEAAAPAAGAGLGRLVDVGTGSGILAIAAAKLGWAPVVALDNDPVALVSARENAAENGVQSDVELHEADTDGAEEAWFDDATVLANMTLEPVSLLLQRLAGVAAGPRRLVVSGILAGSQEEQIMLTAHESGFTPGRRLYEGEWVSFELFPAPEDPLSGGL